MFQTAFQRDAFQNDAFQIGIDSGGIGGGWIYRRKVKKKVKKLVKKYEKIAKALPEAKELLSAIDPYVFPENAEQWDRRAKAQFVLDKLPSASRINWLSMAENTLAIERFKQSTDQLLVRLMQINKQQEDEVLILLLMMEI